MSSKISISALADRIVSDLQAYSDEVGEAVTNAVKNTTKLTVRRLRNTSPKQTGDYRKGWTSVQKTNTKGRYVKVVCNRPKEYRLTHLLEKGHAKTGGGTVPPVVHIAPARDVAEEELRTLIEEALD